MRRMAPLAICIVHLGFIAVAITHARRMGQGRLHASQRVALVLPALLSQVSLRKDWVRAALVRLREDRVERLEFPAVRFGEEEVDLRADC